MTTLSDLLIATPKYQVTIPSSGKKTAFRPFLVKEEKILLLAQEGNDPDASVLPLFDIEYLFLRIRGKSVGEEVKPIIICPETGEEVEILINLSDVDVVKTRGHKQKIKLTDDLVVEMKYPTLGLLKQRSAGIDYTSPSSFYDLISDCIDKIKTKDETMNASEHSREELTSFVDNMTKDQFEKLLDFFTTAPKIEHRVKYTTSDGEEREVLLSGLSDFFG